MSDREQFEQFIRDFWGDRYAGDVSMLRDIDGSYCDPATHWQWKAFEAAKSNQWHPIESIPDDESVLLYQPAVPNDTKRMHMKDRMIVSDSNVPPSPRMTTHWMKLPNPPKGSRT